MLKDTEYSIKGKDEMVEIRKIVTTREMVFSELGVKRHDWSCVLSAWR